MAFKRSAVRSRLSPPLRKSLESQRFQDFCFEWRIKVVGIWRINTHEVFSLQYKDGTIAIRQKIALLSDFKS